LHSTIHNPIVAKTIPEIENHKSILSHTWKNKL